MKFHICLLRNLLLLIFMLAAGQVFATHNRAGEITYRQISKFTYEITLITYTDSRSTSADRPKITLNWGDNTSNDVDRDSQMQIGNNTFRNVYIQTHTYPGAGTYTIQFQDPNRIENIINMTNSVYVPFYVESQLQINPSVGVDRSPILLQPPIDFAQVGEVFTHNPNAYDPDGDSLVFTLIAPKKAVGQDVPGYETPKYSHSFTLDRFTGQLVWDAPKLVGIYNIAILIEEYRKNRKIGYIIRDMQIIVNAGNNRPPVIDSLKDTCVEAGIGASLHIPVGASDIDQGQHVTLTATGGPFLQKVSPATFTTAYNINKVKSYFDWKIECEHIRRQPYRVVFKAVDDDNINPLADIKYIDVKVVGPAPKDLKATVLGSAVTLSWQPPDNCNAKGYFIYRRVDSSSWKHGYCETGVAPVAGFQLIDTILNNHTFTRVDSNGTEGLSPGIDYCYLVTAVYLNEGQYDYVEGYASNQVCARLNKDVPVITNVSIRTTDDFDGSAVVAWSKPTKLDTIKQPGPYRYIVSRLLPGGKTKNVGTFSSNYFGTLTDTMFVDSPIDTRSFQYTYKINFQNTINSLPKNIGKTVAATSIFLKVDRGDHKLRLSWNVKVPWINKYFAILRKDEGSTTFDSIGWTTNKFYVDSGLSLGKTFCYLIKSVGSYSSPGFVDPIINLSERVCSSPKDTVKPCPPALASATGDCDTRNSYITWTIPQLECNGDVTAYKIYFSKRRTNSFVKVDSIPVSPVLEYKDIREELRTSLAGCYYVTAVDSFGNESDSSNQLCVDNCPIYRLPNVFTPGEDGKNDFFGPMNDYRFVESVDMKIFNRWGMVVFETKDPAIRWDGKDIKTGQPLPAGTYFYLCTVNEIYLDGIRKSSPLKGTITIIR